MNTISAGLASVAAAVFSALILRWLHDRTGMPTDFYAGAICTGVALFVYAWMVED